MRFPTELSGRPFDLLTAPKERCYSRSLRDAEPRKESGEVKTNATHYTQHRATKTSHALGLIEGLILRPGARDVAALVLSATGSLDRLSDAVLALSGRGRLGLVTGAYLAWADEPAAETDGPVGVAAVAAIAESLGIETVVLTDDVCEAVVASCLDTAEVRRGPVPVPHTATVDDLEELGAELGLSAVLAVERLGPNAVGRKLTMGGVDVTAFTAPLEVLFNEPTLYTAAIGDGGNEIGMSRVPAELLSRVIERGSEIRCEVSVSDLMIAGTSNWGCYGLLTALAIKEPRCRSVVQHFLDPDTDLALVKAAVSAGGIDGVNGDSGISVDSVPCDGYKQLMLALRALTEVM